jgi:hypothetical protein
MVKEDDLITKILESLLKKLVGVVGVFAELTPSGRLVFEVREI